MKYFSLITILFLFSSCGSYSEHEFQLSEAQETALRNRMTAKCRQDNAALFNSLETNTLNSFTSLTKGYKYDLTVDDEEEEEIVILQKDASTIYVYVSSVDEDIGNRVYKYTSTNNIEHLTMLKNIACSPLNSFSGTADSFAYTANEYEPDKTDPDRTEYSSQYTVAGNKPVFFSLFKRSYSKKVYEDDAQDSTASDAVSYEYSSTLTLDDLDSDDFENYQEKFDAAEHCIFDVCPAAPAECTNVNWLGANYTDTFATSMDDASCALNRFSWSSATGVISH